MISCVQPTPQYSCRIPSEKRSEIKKENLRSIFAFLSYCNFKTYTVFDFLFCFLLLGSCFSLFFFYGVYAVTFLIISMLFAVFIIFLYIRKAFINRTNKFIESQIFVELIEYVLKNFSLADMVANREKIKFMAEFLSKAVFKLKNASLAFRIIIIFLLVLFCGFVFLILMMNEIELGSKNFRGEVSEGTNFYMLGQRMWNNNFGSLFYEVKIISILLFVVGMGLGIYGLLFFIRRKKLMYELVPIYQKTMCAKEEQIRNTTNAVVELYTMKNLASTTLKALKFYSIMHGFLYAKIYGIYDLPGSVIMIGLFCCTISVAGTFFCISIYGIFAYLDIRNPFFGDRSSSGFTAIIQTILKIFKTKKKEDKNFKNVTQLLEQKITQTINSTESLGKQSDDATLNRIVQEGVVNSLKTLTETDKDFSSSGFEFIEILVNNYNLFVTLIFIITAGIFSFVIYLEILSVNNLIQATTKNTKIEGVVNNNLRFLMEKGKN